MGVSVCLALRRVLYVLPRNDVIDRPLDARSASLLFQLCTLLERATTDVLHVEACFCHLGNRRLPAALHARMLLLQLCRRFLTRKN